MPFALGTNPSTSELSDAINYLLNNFGSNISIDLTTGIIAGPSGRISNLYKYIQIKYATSYDGSVGFSDTPTNAIYYGIRNSNDPTESTNPNDYIWYKTIGFGTTNFLWYIVAGGRQIDFYVSATQPNEYYVKDPGTAIDIDIITATKTVNTAVPAIFIWTSGSAPARPTTTTTYTWSTGSYTAPAGWSTTPTTNTTPGYVQWQIRIPLTVNTNIISSTLDWTNTAYPITQFSSNGASGVSGYSGTSGISGFSGVSGSQSTKVTVYQWASSIPTISGTSTYTWATNTITSPPSGWYTSVSDAPSVGFTLFAASVTLTDSVNATTSTIYWTSASIVPFGYAGSTGAIPRTCYSKTTLTTLSPTPFTITTSGSTTFPASGSWGTGTSWSAVVPTLSAGESLWQSDGVYNATTGDTIWGVPYLSSFKVGNLAAVSTNTGNLTVSGTFQAYTAAITGSTLSGSGAVIYSSGKFGIGSSTNNIVYDGTNLNINGSSNINITGTGVFNGASTIPTYGTSAIVANNYYATDYGINTFSQSTFITSGALRAWNTQSGGGNAIYANHGGTGNAVLAQSTSGIGVYGTGITGVQGSGSNGVIGYGTTGNSGVLGVTLGTGFGVYSNGIMGTNNSSLVSNLYSQFTQTVVGTTSNQLRFVQGTLTGSGTAAFLGTNKPGSNTSNTWIQIQVDSTTLYIPVWT
jgi:hypothetical protein